MMMIQSVALTNSTTASTATSPASVPDTAPPVMVMSAASHSACKTQASSSEAQS